MDSQTPIPTECCKNDRCFKISAIIIGILIVIGLFGNMYLLLKKETPLVVQAIPTPIPTQTIFIPTSIPTSLPTNVEATSWKTYTNDFAGFSLKYPEDFVFTEKSFSTKEKQTIFTGNAGKLTIDMATLDISPGWGGGCDEKDSYQFTFMGKARSICLTQNSLHELYETNPGKSQINISATFNSPYEENKNTIFQILSTFKFQ